MAIHPPPTVLSFCTGAAGLDLGVHSVFPGLLPVGYVEWEAYAGAVLVARMADKALGAAPLWDNALTFRGGHLSGLVGWMVAGTPCTDLSGAGRMAGLDGEASGVWWSFYEWVRRLRPAFIVWENVASGVTGAALPYVVGALEAAGYVVAEGPDGRPYVVLGADDVDAPHRRLRVFIFAYLPGVTLGGLAYHDSSGWRRRSGPGGQGSGRKEPAHGSGAVGHAHGNGQQGQRSGGVLDGERAALRNDVDGHDRPPTLELASSGRGAVGHAGREGLEVGAPLGSHAGAQRAPVERTGLEVGPGVFPPRPGELERWAHALERQPWRVPALTSETESLLRGMDDGMGGRVDFAHRAERLRMCGGGVVPQQAALALRLFLRGLPRAVRGW